MSPKEALAVLCAAFQVKDSPSPTLRLYETKMADIPPTLLAETVNRLIEQAEHFGILPPIATIRRTAARLAEVLPPGAEEALALIRAADVEHPVFRRDGSYAYTEHEWVWPEGTSPELLGMIRTALSTVGDPVGKDGERIFAWEHGFKAAYERSAVEGTQRALADLSRAVLPSPARRALPKVTQPAVAAPADGPSLEKVRALVRETVAGLEERKDQALRTRVSRRTPICPEPLGREAGPGRVIQVQCRGEDGGLDNAV